MSPNINQTPEEAARDRIEERLRAAGWHVQDKESLDFNAGPGIAVREYQTDIGPADYVLFAERQAVSVVEAKPDDWGEKLFRDNQHENACCLIRECSLVRVPLPHQDAPHRIPDHCALWGDCAES